MSLLKALSNSLMEASKFGSSMSSGCSGASIFLDDDDANLRDLFGSGWQNNQTKVRLELIFRGVSSIAGFAYWAWILETYELNEDNFFCSIEYGDQGIVVSKYKVNDGLENACRGCMGDSDKVFYKKYSTPCVFGEILAVAVEKKEKYKGEFYNVVSRNNRNFAINLGKFLINKTLTTVPEIFENFT